MGLIRASSVLRRNQTATTAAIYEGIIDALPTAFWKDPKFVSYGASAAELDKCIISGFSTALHSPSNLVVYDTTAAYLRSGVVPLSPAAFRTPCSLLRPTTIMDKSLGTNLHLWHFFTRAKQNHLHLFIPSPSAPFFNVGHVYTLFLQSFNIVLGEGGEATHFKTDNSAF